MISLSSSEFSGFSVSAESADEEPLDVVCASGGLRSAAGAEIAAVLEVGREALRLELLTGIRIVFTATIEWWVVCSSCNLRARAKLSTDDDDEDDDDNDIFEMMMMILVMSMLMR